MSRNYKVETLKKLCTMSGNKCAFPGCLEKLYRNGIRIGVIVHIEGLQPKGARHNQDQTDTERNSFDNLMLMCGNHHSLVDNDRENYDVELLKKWKADHESKQNTSSIDSNLLNEFVISISEDLVFNDSQFLEAVKHYSNSHSKIKDHIFETELRPILNSLPEDGSKWTDVVRTTVGDLIYLSLSEIGSGVLIQSWLDVLITIVDRWDNETRKFFSEMINDEVTKLWNDMPPTSLLMMLILKLENYSIDIMRKFVIKSLSWKKEEFDSLVRYIDFFTFCKRHPEKVPGLKSIILQLINEAENIENEESFRRLKQLDILLKQHS